MVVLVKCNWTNRRKRHLCLNKLSNADNNYAAATIRACCCQCTATTAATKTIGTRLRRNFTTTCTATTNTASTNIINYILISRARATASSIINFIPVRIKKDRTRKTSATNSTYI